MCRDGAGRVHDLELSSRAKITLAKLDQLYSLVGHSVQSLCSQDLNWTVIDPVTAFKIFVIISFKILLPFDYIVRHSRKAAITDLIRRVISLIVDTKKHRRPRRLTASHTRNDTIITVYLWCGKAGNRVSRLPFLLILRWEFIIIIIFVFLVEFFLSLSLSLWFRVFVREGNDPPLQRLGTIHHSWAFLWQ